MHVLIPQAAPVVSGGERYPVPPSTDLYESPPSGGNALVEAHEYAPRLAEIYDGPHRGVAGTKGHGVRQARSGRFLAPVRSGPRLLPESPNKN